MHITLSPVGVLGPDLMGDQAILQPSACALRAQGACKKPVGLPGASKEFRMGLEGDVWDRALSLSSESAS